MPPARIAVFPSAALLSHARLFGALGQAFAVSFHDGMSDAAGQREPPAAMIGFGAAGAAAALALPGVPALLGGDSEAVYAGPSRTVLCGEDPALPRVLRSANLTDAYLPDGDLAGVEPADRVLATVDGRPAWLLAADAMRHVVSVLPAELEVDEPLRGRLRSGRNLAMIALVHFLREVSGWGLPTPAPVRAAFLFDDPNLHWPSYGHLRFPDLSMHAREHGYHVSIAMIPRDGRFCHPSAVSAFRNSHGRLSLCVHGNDHFGAELGRLTSVSAGLSLGAQALARTAAFERRTGLSVDRVMVPPHECLSEAATLALAQLPYDAVCVTRPFPWLVESVETPWLTAPAGVGHLVGWGPGTVMPGGLPALLRIGFAAPDEELVLRAFLGQPVVLYDHHGLLADGLDVLSERAEAVNRLGDVRWCSLSEVAKGAAEVRLSGPALEVRMLGRRIDFRAPQGVSRVRIDAGEVATSEEDSVVLHSVDGVEPEIPAAAPSSVRASLRGLVEARLQRTLPPDIGPTETARLSPALRRIATEARDRLSVLGSGRRRVVHRAFGVRRPEAAPRVLILTENGSVPSDRRVWQESTTLVQAGYEVHVLCPYGSREDEREREELREGVHIHRYPPRFAEGDGVLGYVSEYAWAMFQTWLATWRMSRRQAFDVVHACNPPDLLLLAAWPARRRGARQIFDHHDLVPELLTERFGDDAGLKRRVLSTATRLAERVAFGLADIVISTNESYAEIARTRGHVPAQDVFVVRNGPDLDRFTPVARDEQLRHGAPCLIAYVGIMGPQDGVDQALRALAVLKRTRGDWYAVFGGTGSARAELEALTDVLGLSGHVHFAGWLDDEGIARLLSTADICLAPEPKTPFNDASTMIKVAEYMAMGRPAVAFDLHESRRTAGEAAVYATDIDGYAAAIATLMDDPDRRRWMGAVGRERVEGELGWHRSAAELLAAYRAALGPNRVPRGRARSSSRRAVEDVGSLRLVSASSTSADGPGA